MEYKVKNYYKLLNVPFGASIEEIKKAFRELAKQYHPDVAGEEYTEYFKEIVEAFQVLSEPESKKIYDEFYKRVIKERDWENLEEVNIKAENIKDIGYPLVVPPSRIEYSITLRGLLERGLKIFENTFKHEDFVEELGSDIVIYLTDEEVVFGSVAIIELPARKLCPVCHGERGVSCYLCGGLGFINTTEKIKIIIQPNILDDYIIEINPNDYKPYKFMDFNAKKLRIKIRHFSKYLKEKQNTTLENIEM